MSRYINNLLNIDRYILQMNLAENRGGVINGGEFSFRYSVGPTRKDRVQVLPVSDNGSAIC